MNNTTTTTTRTKRNLALAAVFVAVTLVVGTLATTTNTIATTGQSAYAYSQKEDNGKGNDNGNTVTIEECKNRGSASGFDTALDQECENLICTHPGENATCVQEGVVTSTPTSTPTTIQVSGQGEGEIICPGQENTLPASITFSVKQSGSAAAQGQFEIIITPPGLQFTKTGTLDSVQITGNSFTITGTELHQNLCIPLMVPTSATISGQCGTGVTIQFATADGEHATFTGNVACT
jgi:hypothetical protein